MNDLLKKYNYDSFVPEQFEPWMQFPSSPTLGEKGPDHPLWNLEDGSEVQLSQILSEHLYTVVEFGSFT